VQRRRADIFHSLSEIVFYTHRRWCDSPTLMRFRKSKIPKDHRRRRWSFFYLRRAVVGVIAVPDSIIAVWSFLLRGLLVCSVLSWVGLHVLRAFDVLSGSILYMDVIETRGTQCAICFFVLCYGTLTPWCVLQESPFWL